MENREIKFRALKDDVSNCVFYYGYLIYDSNGTPKIYDADTSLFHTCIKGTEGQFTGLKDRHGKDIYEGDIFSDGSVVEFFYGLTWDGGGSLHSGFYCKKWFDYNEPGELSYHYGFDDLEIIGNIHENPELLNK